MVVVVVGQRLQLDLLVVVVVVGQRLQLDLAVVVLLLVPEAVVGPQRLLLAVVVVGHLLHLLFWEVVAVEH